MPIHLLLSVASYPPGNIYRRRQLAQTPCVSALTVRRRSRGAALRMGSLADGMCASGNSDVIVVGLGAMGSATCYQLAARGVSVIGLDQYEPPHPYGSTHGETRITRLAIGEGDDYAPLVRRAHELWPEIEQLTGARLLIRTGGVILGHGGSPFLRRTRDSARRFGIEHENLSNDQVRERFPMFAVDHRTEGFYEPEAGYSGPSQRSVPS